MSGGKGVKLPVELSAAEKLHEASQHINKAKHELSKLQALYKPGDSAYGQCETVDDHLFEALRLLGS